MMADLGAILEVKMTTDGLEVVLRMKAKMRVIRMM